MSINTKQLKLIIYNKGHKFSPILVMFLHGCYLEAVANEYHGTLLKSASSCLFSGSNLHFYITKLLYNACCLYI